MTSNDAESIIHVAGPYDPEHGQRCSRCGYLLIPGGMTVSQVWDEGEEVMVDDSGIGGGYRVSVLSDDRDTSNERPCIADEGSSDG